MLYRCFPPCSSLYITTHCLLLLVHTYFLYILRKWGSSLSMPPSIVTILGVHFYPHHFSHSCQLTHLAILDTRILFCLFTLYLKNTSWLLHLFWLSCWSMTPVPLSYFYSLSAFGSDYPYQYYTSNVPTNTFTTIMLLSISHVHTCAMPVAFSFLYSQH